MKSQDLKKSILQYAMKGKLVAQDPTDEHASELLKRIKAEKERLIKEGKIKKEKPLPPITQDEIPYELPQGWEWVRLGNIIKISSGNFLPAEKMNQSGNIPVYGGNGINGYHNEYIVDKPTLIIGRVGFYCGCVHLSKGKAWVTDNAFITRFSEKNLNIRFLQLLLISSDLGKNDNATAQPVVSGKKIYPLVVPIPPLAEQKRIVEKLEEILPLVEEYGRNEEILSEINQKLPKQIRQSILQYAVQGKLVDQDPNDEPASELPKRIKAEKERLIKDGKIKKEKPLQPITQTEIPYELPQGWVWARLGDVVNYGSTGTVDNNNKLDENTWILDLEDIEKESSRLLVKNTIKHKSFNSSKKIFKKGDVLYGKLRPYLDKVIVAEEDGICTTEILPLRIYYGIDSYYLKWFLKSPMFIQYVNQLTYGIKMPRLGTEDGKNALLALPPLAEQKRIVAKVEELMKIVDKLEL